MSDIVRTPPHIGAVIRRRRKLKGLTQAQLGEKTKLRQATISQLEAGEGGTQIRTLTDVLAVLNLEMVVQDRSTSPYDIEDLF